MSSYLDLFDKVPFGTIPDRHFALLRPEADELARHHARGSRVLLEGPRRIGKTLLVKSVIPPENLLLIDLKGLKTEQRVINSIRSCLENFTGKPIGASRQTTTKSQAGGGGSLAYLRSKTKQTTEQTDLETLFSEISKLGKTHALLVVFFDEIQSLLEFKGGLAIAERIRSLSQHHSHIAYFFAGSNSYLLNQLTDEPDTPFYKQLTRVTLHPIDREDFSVWIRKRLTSEKLKISDDTLEFIFEFARDIPGDIQRVLGDAFVLTKSRKPPVKTITTQIVEFAIERALSDQALILDAIIGSLRRNQRFLLLAIAARLHTGKNPPFTGTIMKRATRINSPGTIESTRAALAKRGLISLWQDQYMIDDPYLEAALINRYPTDYEQIAEVISQA